MGVKAQFFFKAIIYKWVFRITRTILFKKFISTTEF